MATPPKDSRRPSVDLERALAITERIRSSLDLADVLQQTVDELGHATGASRCLLQLEPGADGTSLMVEWDRGDTRPLGYRPPTPIAQRIFATGERIVIADVSAVEDEGLATYLRAVGSVAAVNYPIHWHGVVLAVLGLQDDKPREWEDGAIPLLSVVEAQVGAALAQARLWEERERAVAELERLNALREELVATVSHELRTPLAAIIGAVKTLRRADVEVSAEQERQLFGVLEEQADRLRILADDVLDLARFQAGEVALRPERARLSQLVERARAAAPLADGRELRLHVEDDAPVVVDPHRIGQVLSNLLANAAKHGRGDVTVTAGRGDRGEAVITDSDEGDGVPDPDRDDVFAPFAHRSDRSDSTGLGLAIARRIVEAHGGALVYEPPDGDRRHRFVVRLPDGRRHDGAAR